MSSMLEYISAHHIVVFTLCVPLFGTFFATVTRSPFYRDLNTLIVSVTLFVNVLNLFSLSARGSLPEIILAEPVPGLPISLYIEPLGTLFAMVVSFLWMVTSIYSFGYMRANHEPRQPQFYAFFSVAIFAALGIAFAGNLITLFLFYELLTLCTYPLVTHHGDDASRRAGRIYLGILLGTSLCLFLPAIFLTWNIAGTTDFNNGGILHGKASSAITGLLLMLFVFGVGKAAIMPLHRWLPAAMVAPTPVSALLHAVAVVKAGVFTLIKIIVYIFGVDNLQQMIDINWWSGGWLVYLAGITIVLASVTALRHNNLKMRLAYSTISQLSYIVMACALLSPYATIGAGFHIVAHGFGKITLFFAAGAIYTASRKTNISDLDGIGRRMPWTMAAFTIGALSIIGVPPLSGFLSKYYILLGAVDSQAWFAIGVLILSTLLNAAYFLPIVHAAFFKKEQHGGKAHGEAPLLMIIAMGISAGMTFVSFLYPDIFLWLMQLVAGL